MQQNPPGRLMTDLVDIARELYALAPDEFTATRNERAAHARTDGDKELALSIRSLQKPSTAAWALNLLVRERSDEIGQALELGQTLRAAQAELDSGALRTLSQQRRALVAALGKQAAALAKASGHRISEAVVTQIEQTLNAAMADARAAVALKTARLTRSLDSMGLEPVDLAGAVAAAEEGLFDSAEVDEAAQALSVAEPASAARDGERPPTRTGPSKRQVAQARQKAADAAGRADDATATLETITGRIDEAARHRDRLAAELEDLLAQLAALEARISAADREADRLERERDKASRTAETAQAAADRARERLDALE